VADLHAWLRIIGRPDDSAALVRVLLGSRYRLGLGDLAPVANWRAAARPGAGAEPDGPGPAMLEAFDHLDGCTGLSPRRSAACRASATPITGCWPPPRG